MNCPLCNHILYELINEWFCPRHIQMVEGSECTSTRFFHFLEDKRTHTATMYITPYRIISFPEKNTSEIAHYGGSTFSELKTFKTILKCAYIPPAIEDKLQTRLKLLLLVS